VQEKQSRLLFARSERATKAMLFEGLPTSMDGILRLQSMIWAVVNAV
jgi:hypothetical protein